MSSTGSLRRDLPSYKRQGVFRNFFRTLVAVLILLFFVGTFIEGFFIRSVRIGSQSMYPGIVPGDLIFASPLKYGKASFFSDGTWMDFGTPDRGDIVLLEPPYHVPYTFIERIADHFIRFFTLEYLHYQRGGASEKSWENTLVIRRVIALPGDKVYVNNGIVYIKTPDADHFVSENEIGPTLYRIELPDRIVGSVDQVFADQTAVFEIAPGHVFVAADNREGTLDSRHWGPVRMDKLRGQLLLRYWPISSAGPLN